MLLGEIQDALMGKTVSYTETRDGETCATWGGKVVSVVLDAVLIAKTIVLWLDADGKRFTSTISVSDAEAITRYGALTRKSDSGGEVKWEIKD